MAMSVDLCASTLLGSTCTLYFMPFGVVCSWPDKELCVESDIDIYSGFCMRMLAV